MTYRILLLNGPNLNLTGLRNRAIYGNVTLPYIIQQLQIAGMHQECEVEAKQSNYEGRLITWIHRAAIVLDPEKVVHGIILNAGGLTHTSVSLRDAVEAARDLGVPTVEVHLSDIYSREPFRQVSLLSDVCFGKPIMGIGSGGYFSALQRLAEYFQGNKADKKRR